MFGKRKREETGGHGDGYPRIAGSTRNPRELKERTRGRNGGRSRNREMKNIGSSEKAGERQKGEGKAGNTGKTTQAREYGRKGKRIKGEDG